VALTARKDTAQRLADALGLSSPDRDSFEAAARGRALAGAFPALGTGVDSVAAATRTLPRDIASFTGRESELRQLAAAAASVAGSGGVVGIHAIGGMAGVGNSTPPRPFTTLRATYTLKTPLLPPTADTNSAQAMTSPSATAAITAALFARSIDRHLAQHDLKTSRAAPVTSKGVTKC